jgi:hypothetical protein
MRLLKQAAETGESSVNINKGYERHKIFFDINQQMGSRVTNEGYRPHKKA